MLVLIIKLWLSQSLSIGLLTQVKNQQTKQLPVSGRNEVKQDFGAICRGEGRFAGAGWYWGAERMIGVSDTMAEPLTLGSQVRESHCGTVWMSHPLPKEVSPRSDTFIMSPSFLSPGQNTLIRKPLQEPRILWSQAGSSCSLGLPAAPLDSACALTGSEGMSVQRSVVRSGRTRGRRIGTAAAAAIPADLSRCCC